MRHIGLERHQAPAELSAAVDHIARSGGAPLAASDGVRLVGDIHSKDVVKPNVKARFADLRRMGLCTVMITGDNPVTAAPIARVARRPAKRTLQRGFPLQLSMVEPDPAPLEQALVNILEKAVADSLERVFDKFPRLGAVSDRSKGVGLGLSIAKGFVEAMGGRIAAASPTHGDAVTGFYGRRILISLLKTTETHPMLF